MEPDLEQKLKAIMNPKELTDDNQSQLWSSQQSRKVHQLQKFPHPSQCKTLRFILTLVMNSLK